MKLTCSPIAVFLIMSLMSCAAVEDETNVTVAAVSSCAAGAPICAPTPPVRPTYQDVSIRTPLGSFYQWFRGRIATQAQRDAMEETLTAIALPEAIRYARTMDSCAATVKSTISELTKITMRLGPVYEQQ